VLPAIQREFVWKPEQIERLFDSLMQGYPFGTFLFWKVDPVTSGKFKFYDFVLNYHQRDAAHCPELPTLYNQAVTAVLDGQQRLTSLNIGLRGSMAVKQPNKWWTNPDAFPKRILRLNLLAPTEPDEDGVVYEFRFLDDTQATRSPSALWFEVPDILGMKDGPAMLNWLVAQQLAGRELKLLGFSDIRKVVSWRNELVTRTEKGEDGEPVMVLMPRVTIVDADKISDEAAAAVAEVWQTVNGALRVKLHDKHAALVSIGKHLGMFVDRVQIQERKQISAEPMSAEEWKRQYVREG